MTPLKSARVLSQHFAQGTLVVMEGAGHMLLAERPGDVQGAIAHHLKKLPA
jgi:hypothetical protein